MIRVSELFIYPVKSLPGISVSEAEVLERGFRYDRRWMIVDEENNCVTQRTHPQLSQIKISIIDEQVQLVANGQELGLNPSKSQLSVTIWDDQVEAFEGNDLQNEWISDFLGASCKLVFMPEGGKRAVNPDRAKNQENVSFADGYPYLVISEESLADLNDRMAAPLPMNRFRPNIVVSGGEPYAEDQWREMGIGEVSFYGTHPCKRCVFTTIDQETMQKGAEPLKTLATYRKEGSNVVFGLNALASSRGTVRVGDQLRLG